MTHLLEVSQLAKAFGGRQLWTIESLHLNRGCAYVLTGSNGSGKSTLLRVLSGLDKADSGTLKWQGQHYPLSPYPAALRHAVVYVHQHPVLFSTNVVDNVAYGPKVRGMKRTEVRERVLAAMKWAGVAHLENTPVHRLSGGEVQRVALARAHVLQPPLLLLDEPTSGLDGTAREMVIALVASFIAQGRTMVIACHDRELINLTGMVRLKLRDGALQVRPVEPTSVSLSSQEQ